MTSIGIIDSNICNLTSVLNALTSLELAAASTSDPDSLRRFSHLILPGVGSFAKGMETLAARQLDEAVVEAVRRGTPLLGLCLGMQFLAKDSTEFGLTNGLGLIDGSVRRLAPQSPDCRVPHIGWNGVEPVRNSILLRAMPETPPCFYFVHSFAFDDPAAAHVSGVTDHGGPVVAVVEQDNVFGVQFHPERSQRCGLALLKNFATLC